jgi:hypothetical protein
MNFHMGDLIVSHRKFSGRADRAYTGSVADSLKIPKKQFDAVLDALLKAPPMPMAGIAKKREPKQMNGPRSDRGFGGKKKR